MTSKKLRDTYFDPSSPGSYGGVTALSRQTQTKRDVVKDWLSFQDAYTLHKQKRKRFQRRKTIVSGMDQQWQIDLVDIQGLKSQNDGMGYILTAIDVFSKMAYARALKNKTSKSIIAALDSIFESATPPKTIQTDKGSEFMNRAVQQYFLEKDIRHFTSENEDLKAAVVERYNRTLKSKMWRFFTHRGHNRYVDVLPKLVQSYNNSVHRSIGMRPVDVNLQNQEEVWNRLYGQPIKKTSPKLKVGDRVRMTKYKGVFTKGYIGDWSEELFRVSAVLKTTPVTYKLKDDNDEDIIGSFYEQELQKVGEKTEYEIESVLRERVNKRGGRESLVKWRGYNDTFNSWIPAREIHTYKSRASLL